MGSSRIQNPPHAAWDAEKFEGLYRCVHCGLCLNACPTFRELGVETDSPRGRLYLMRAMVEGRLEPTEGVITHMHRCLVCRACETACPSGVPFGNLMELTRDEIQRRGAGSPASKLLRKVLLRGVFPFPERLRALGRLSRLYQRSGLQAVARRLGLMPGKLAEVEALMPAVSDEFFDAPAGEWFRAGAPAGGGEPSPLPSPSGRGRRYRVGLLSGCIMSIAFAEVDRATVRVLNRNGCDVFVPKAQTCCGALHAHDGDRETAQELARRNIDAFEREQLDGIIVNAAGCGATMKEYGELLHDDSAFSARAMAFAAQVKDISEFLASIQLNRDFGRIEQVATYQDACHLAHGQRVREAPRALLRCIPGLKLVEMQDSDRCCGSAGIYNITQPDLSKRFMAEKSAAADATDADIMVSGNPGCMIQLRAGLRQRGSRMAVRHIVEVLDEAYQRAEERHAD